MQTNIQNQFRAVHALIRRGEFGIACDLADRGIIARAALQAARMAHEPRHDRLEGGVFALVGGQIFVEVK